MDPSNFGSFSSGGNFGGTGATGTQNGGVASGTGTIASPQQSAPVQAQGFVGAQAAQPQMQQSGQVGAIPGGARSQMFGLQMAQPQIVQPQMATQPQALGSMQFQPQMVSSSTEDVVLGGAGPKKSRRGVIVGVVIAVLVLVGVGVGAMFLVNRSDNSSPKGQNELVASSFGAYKYYANFLVYGAENDEDISDDVLWERQDVVTDVMAFYSIEERLTYADTLQGLYGNFSELFSGVDLAEKFGEDSDLVKSLYESVGAGVDSLSQYIRNGNVLSSSIARAYLDNGSDGVLNLLNEAYGDMENLGDSIYDRFVAAKRSEAEAMILLYDYYSSIGCIADGVLDELCVESYSSDDLAVSLINDVEAAANESDLLKYQMISDTVSSSSELYSILRGGANV